MGAQQTGPQPPAPLVKRAPCSSPDGSGRFVAAGSGGSAGGRLQTGPSEAPPAGLNALREPLRAFNVQLQFSLELAGRIHRWLGRGGVNTRLGRIRRPARLRGDALRRNREPRRNTGKFPGGQPGKFHIEFVPVGQKSDSHDTIIACCARGQRSWSAVSCQRSAVSRQRSAVSRQPSAVSGQRGQPSRSAVSGQRSAVSRQRSAVSGQPSAVSFQLSFVSGFCAGNPDWLPPRPNVQRFGGGSAVPAALSMVRKRPLWLRRSAALRARGSGCIRDRCGVRVRHETPSA